jgi:hypothetical protein
LVPHAKSDVGAVEGVGCEWQADSEHVVVLDGDPIWELKPFPLLYARSCNLQEIVCLKQLLVLLAALRTLAHMPILSAPADRMSTE